MRYEDLQAWFLDLSQNNTSNPNNHALIKEVEGNINNIVKNLDGQEGHNISNYENMKRELAKLNNTDIAFPGKALSNLISELDPRNTSKELYDDWYRIRIVAFDDRKIITDIMSPSDFKNRMDSLGQLFNHLNNDKDNKFLYMAIAGQLTDIGRKMQQFINKSDSVKNNFDIFFNDVAKFHVPEDLKITMLAYREKLLDYIINEQANEQVKQQNKPALNDLKNAITSLEYFTTGDINSEQKQKIDAKVIALDNKTPIENLKNSNFRHKVPEQAARNSSVKIGVKDMAPDNKASIEKEKLENLLDEFKAQILTGKWEVSKFKSTQVYTVGMDNKKIKLNDIPPSMKTILVKINQAFDNSEKLKTPEEKIKIYKKALEEIHNISAHAADKKTMTIFGGEKNTPQKEFYKQVRNQTKDYAPSPAPLNASRPKNG